MARAAVLAALTLLVGALGSLVSLTPAVAQTPTPSSTQPTCMPPFCGSPSRTPSPTPSLSLSPTAAPTTVRPTPSPTRTTARPAPVATTRAPRSQTPRASRSELPVAPTTAEPTSASPSPSPLVESDTDRIDDTDGRVRTFVLLLGGLALLLGVGGSVGLYLTREPRGV